MDYLKQSVIFVRCCAFVCMVVSRLKCRLYARYTDQIHNNKYELICKS